LASQFGRSRPEKTGVLLCTIYLPLKRLAWAAACGRYAAFRATRRGRGLASARETAAVAGGIRQRWGGLFWEVPVE